MIALKPRLNREFFLRDTLTISKELLGKYLVREINGEKIVAKITETEAYIGAIDKACHAYNYKKTDRTAILFKKGGHIYVYLIYGMYCCLNFVCDKENEPCAVLIRSVNIIHNIELASRLRYDKKYNDLSKYQIKNFTNGPGKLCKALNIDKNLNSLDIDNNLLYITEGENVKNFNTSKRINIDYSQEAIDFPWRFYIWNN